MFVHMGPTGGKPGESVGRGMLIASSPMLGGFPVAAARRLKQQAISSYLFCPHMEWLTVLACRLSTTDGYYELSPIASNASFRRLYDTFGRLRVA